MDKRKKLSTHKKLKKGEVMELLGKELNTPAAVILIRKYGSGYTVEISGFERPVRL